MNDSLPSRPSAGGLNSDRVLARGVVWGLLGQAAPMSLALLAIPPLIAGLGADRFGFLALAWLVVGYFGLFDLGLGRALTRVVSERLGAGREAEVPSLVWTSLLLMAGLGLAGALALAAAAPWVVRVVIAAPPGLRRECLVALWVLAASLPVVVTASGLRGVLEAQQRFGAANLVQSLVGVWSLAGPVLVLPYSGELPAAVAVMVAGRVVGWFALLALCLRSLPGLRSPAALRPSAVGPLLRLGGWMTVTNVVGPLMVSADRFLIGSRVALGAVAFYATPYEVVTRLWVVPSALVRVHFPAFAATSGVDRVQTARLFDRAARGTFLALFPATLVIVVLAGDGLRLWLGADFARASARVTGLLAVGVLFNSMGMIAFALVQGVGRADLTAGLHLAELPFYLPAAWWLVGRYGVEGAAVAWSVRAAADAGLLFALSRRLLPAGTPFGRMAGLLGACALPGLALGLPPGAPAARGLALGLCLAAFAASSWFWVLTAGERAAVRGGLGGFPFLQKSRA